MNTFIISQFKYCHLTWMFHNRTINNKINRLHERALRLAYDDENSSFHQLLILDNSVTVHHGNLHNLDYFIFCTSLYLSPIPVQDIFKKQGNICDLRNKRSWVSMKVRSVHYGT